MFLTKTQNMSLPIQEALPAIPKQVDLSRQIDGMRRDWTHAFDVHNIASRESTHIQRYYLYLQQPYAAAFRVP